MDRDRTRPGPADAVSFEARLRSSRVAVFILIPVLLITSVTLLRASGITTRPVLALTGAARDLSPGELASAAADAFELATVVGGTGYTFEVVQHGTMVQKEGGPSLEAPDPSDPAETVESSTQPVGTYLERGVVTPDGFHAEIRKGPDDPRAPPDWESAKTELAALVRDGRTYRNDGSGWYVTDRPPGLGLDPTTASLLPTLLRGLSQPADAEQPPPDASAPPEPGRAVPDPFADLAPARRLDGGTKVDDIPGIIAVDLADATELRGPAELAFDDAGRLVGLRVLARNTHLETYDLLIETVITFAYPISTPELPKPEPVWSPKDGGNS
jgi:hypothetical protein